MLINQYKENEEFVYQGSTYKIVKERFKIISIQDREKSITLDVTDSTGSHKTINFWKNSNNPNLYKDDDGNYKLVEVKENDVIDAVGFSYNYMNQLQFNAVGGYKLVQEEMSYVSNVDTHKLITSIHSMIELIQDEKLRACCKDMTTIYHDELKLKPAAAKHHHNYVGGLLQHTYEVMITSLHIAQCYKLVNVDYIITASLFHDNMKINEYTVDGNWLPNGDMIGHISGSNNVFVQLARKYQVGGEAITNISHIILSHHGRKEWGSPVEPKTPEAIIVHEADMISSYINPLMKQNTLDNRKDYYNKI